jgi:hypothetical protein
MINNPSHAQEFFHSTHLGELGRDATGRDDTPAEDGSSHGDAVVLWIVAVRGQAAGGGYVPSRLGTASRCLYHGTSSDLFAMQRTRADFVRY